MERLFEHLALKIEGEIKNYVSKHRLNKMLEEVKSDEVSEKTLKEALVFDTSKKTQEEQNVNKILVGLMVDSFINKNGQEAFDSLIEELEEEQKGVAVIKPQVVDAVEPEVAVEEDLEPKDEPTERKSIKLTGSKKVTEPTPEPVVEPVVETVEPVTEPVVEAVEPVVEESSLTPIPEPVPPTPTPEPIKPVVVVEPVVEPVPPTPTPEPIRPVIVEEPVGSYAEQQVPEWQMPQQAPQQQMVAPSNVSPKFDDIPPTFEASFEEELLDEVGTEKKGGVLKYLAVGIPTLLLVGGLVFWQLNNQKQVTTKAESQAMEILKGMPKEAKKGDGLSKSEYEDNIEALTKGIDTIKQDDNTGLSGYLVYDDKKYIIKKYEQASGSLIVFDEEGEEIKFDNEWVEKLVKKAKKNKSNTEASPVEEKQEGNPAEQQENKQEENSEGKPEEKPAEQQEGSNV